MKSTERIRKTFRGAPKPKRIVSVLEIATLRAQSGIRAAATRLIDEQLHQAEAAFARLKDAPKSLLFYFSVDFALEHYRRAEHEKLLSEAETEYRAARQWACLEKMDINSGGFDVVFRWLLFEGHRRTSRKRSVRSGRL